MSNEDKNSSDMRYHEGQSSFDSLFYTFEKSYEKMNDDEIFNEILKKYERLEDDELGDIVLRKMIIDLFEDDEFVRKIMSDFNISIYDFIKTLYRKLSWVFSNAMFVKKIKAVILEKKYAE